ncbi:MAG: hypothetical protein COB69_00165 [Phycisphaera sp.]|nr:MAG: hypothetical protein COB69_00165 [Phycisphaera sp.]
MGVFSGVVSGIKGAIGGFTGSSQAGAARQGGKALADSSILGGRIRSDAALGSADTRARTIIQGSDAFDARSREGLALLREQLDPFASAFGQEQIAGLTGLATDPTQQLDFLQGNPLFAALRDQAREATFNTQSAAGDLGGINTDAILQNRFLTLGNDLINQQINRQLPLLQGAQSAAGTIGTGSADIFQRIAQNRASALADAGGARALGVQQSAEARAQADLDAAQARTTGAIGAANASAAGAQNVVDTGFQLAGLLGFSDERFKTNIQKIGEKGGVNVYTWDWNDKAESAGLKGRGVGHIAQQVEKIYPELVHVMPNGYLAIDYGTKNTVRLQ